MQPELFSNSLCAWAGFALLSLLPPPASSPRVPPHPGLNGRPYEEENEQTIAIQNSVAVSWNYGHV